MKGGQKYFTRKRIFTRRKKKTRELWVGLYTEPGLLSCCSWIVRSNTAHLTVCSCCVYTYIYISVCLSTLSVYFLPSGACETQHSRSTSLNISLLPSQTSLDFFGPIQCVCVCVCTATTRFARITFPTLLVSFRPSFYFLLFQFLVVSLHSTKNPARRNIFFPSFQPTSFSQSGGIKKKEKKTIEEILKGRYRLMRQSCFTPCGNACNGTNKENRIDPSTSRKHKKEEEEWKKTTFCSSNFFLFSFDS